jgi:hypothetical protein
MGDIRQLIERRIINFEILLLDHLTPLLREQILHAIALHREALQQPDVDPYLEDLDDLHDQLKGHWTKVYGNLISRAYLLQDIILFQQFLIAKLLEDYTNEPCPVNKWVLDQAKCIIEQEDHAMARDGSVVDTTYQVHVVFPLEEMMLSRDHVENKLLAAAIGLGHSGSDIQRLIDRRDWLNLAMVLTNDRGLALKLFEGQPSGICDAKTYERILQGIDQIKGKYFTELLDSSTFTISTHAREMSAGQASSQYNIGSPPAPLTIRPSNSRPHSEDPSSRNSWTWGIYDVIVSSLKGTKPTYSTSSDANCEETTSLVNLKKAE